MLVGVIMLFGVAGTPGAIELFDRSAPGRCLTKQLLGTVRAIETQACIRRMLHKLEVAIVVLKLIWWV